jgi:hypothetical protein
LQELNTNVGWISCRVFQVSSDVISEEESLLLTLGLVHHEFISITLFVIQKHNCSCTLCNSELQLLLVHQGWFRCKWHAKNIGCNLLKKTIIYNLFKH